MSLPPHTGAASLASERPSASRPALLSLLYSSVAETDGMKGDFFLLEGLPLLENHPAFPIVLLVPSWRELPAFSAGVLIVLRSV